MDRLRQVNRQCAIASDTMVTYRLPAATVGKTPRRNTPDNVIWPDEPIDHLCDADARPMTTSRREVQEPAMTSVSNQMPDNTDVANSASRERQVFDPVDTMPVAELDIQPDWHPDQEHRTVGQWLDLVARFVLLASGVLLVTIVVGSLVLIGLAFVVGYIAMLIGKAILVHLAHPRIGFEGTSIRVTEVSTRPQLALPQPSRDGDERHGSE
jgi:hypothetical protein